MKTTSVPAAQASLALERISRWVFRYRDGLFPLVVAAILLLWPPVPYGEPLGDALWIAGVILIGLGQAIRAITIGLAYIKRGGKDRRFFAPELVVGGIFGHCRNPMYVGNLLIATGLFVAAGAPIGIAVGAGLFLGLYATLIHGEERYLLGRFGGAYRTYCASVPRWRIRLRGLRTTLAAPLDWRKILSKEYGTLFVSLMLPAGLLAWKLVRAGGWAHLEPHLPALAAFAGTVTAAYAVVRILKKQRRFDRPNDTGSARSLTAGRERIDRVDDAILRLLNDRAREVRRVYAVKEQAGIVRFDSVRTERILARVRDANKGPLRDDEAVRVFRSILDTFLELDAVSATTTATSFAARPSAAIATVEPSIGSASLG